jgi:branched-chain amino acid transport system ATP-binding protein
MSLFSVRNLVCHHGLLAAVRDVSFDLAQGEVTCVIGANGAGKTTLMRALAGAHTPSSGSIWLNGAEVTHLPSSTRFRSGIAMSPEGRRLFPDMTVRENLMVAAENGRAGEWTIDSVVGAFPHMEPLLDKFAGGLSGGQRQSAAIARALLANPDVLILDEVSLGLSPAAVGQVYASLEKIRNQRSMSMVIVEQDLARSLSFADQIVCMAEGQVELSGAPSDFTREQITAAYFGIHEGEAAHV